MPRVSKPDESNNISTQPKYSSYPKHMIDQVDNIIIKYLNEFKDLNVNTAFISRLDLRESLISYINTKTGINNGVKMLSYSNREVLKLLSKEGFYPLLVFNYMCIKLSENNFDNCSVDFNVNEFVDDMKIGDKSCICKALSRLISLNLIAKSNRKDIYYINLLVVSKGDKIELYEEMTNMNILEVYDTLSKRLK